jgi:hypothetical protein
MTFKIGCVVEGQGEREAFPLLLRRIIAAVDPALAVEIPRPFKANRSSLVKDQLENAVEAVALRVRPNGAVFVLLDSDDDCPKELGPKLQCRAEAVSIGLPVSVVLCHREFESWFLAAAKSLRGKGGLSDDILPPENPEHVRGAKEWLQSRMTRHAYSETVDQPKLVASMDLQEARVARSFDKCYREVVRLIEHFRAP